MITQERLKEVAVYDPFQGCFHWKIRPTNSVQIGDRMGAVSKRAYEECRIDGKLYLTHRLVWLYTYGYFPKGIDHIDNNPSNNLLCNLREATQVQNGFNTKKSKANKTGVKGLFYHKEQRTYIAKICVGKTTHSIRFKQVEEGDAKVIAEAAIWLKETREKLHGDFANHG
jgi:hypothetical protein